MTRKRLRGLHTAVGAEPPEAPGPPAVSSGSTDPVSEQSSETLKETSNPVTHPSALDLPEQTPDLPEQTPDLPEQTPDLPEQTPDLPEQTPDLPQQKLDLPQQKPELPQQTPDLPQQKLDLPQQKPELPQQKLDLPQQKLDLPQQKPELPQQKLDLPQQKPEKLVEQMDVDDITRNPTQEAGPETSESQLKTRSSKTDEQSNKPERKYETRANYSKTEEDMTPGGSGRRQSTRTLNKQEKALNPDVDKPVTPMSTRGRKAKAEAENEKTQDDGTILTMTRTKPTREESPRREETTSAEEEGTAKVQPSQKPKRGRPKKLSAAVKEIVSLSSKAVLVSEEQMLDSPEDKETAAAEDEVVVKDGGDVTASENQTCSLHHEVIKEPDKREDETLRSSKRHHEEETGSGGEVEQLLGPVAKQPCFDSDVSKLQPSDPDESLGRRFVERKLGFFCSLCSVFYVDKSKMEHQHCCSRGHYNNLKKYYQKLQQLPPRT